MLNGLGEGDTVYEKLSEDPTTAVPIGYSQSKWVTEQICARANESTGLQDRVQVLRIGQLCGDTREGIWNESEGWPLMIKTAQTTGRLPILREVSLAAGQVIAKILILALLRLKESLMATGRCGCAIRVSFDLHGCRFGAELLLKS